VSTIYECQAQTILFYFIIIIIIFRFENYSAWFIHAYQLGLNGAQASWANKNIMDTGSFLNH